MSRAVPSTARKVLFLLIAWSVTLAALLGGTEGVLRLAGSGYSPHFARRATAPSGERVWRENRWCTAPYFTPALVRRPVPFTLPVAKPPGTCRIFVLGSSAAMGDPEASFSLARVLQVLLHGAYPNRRFEVVNAGITAINSHVLRGIAADCARLQPDLCIVYEGNNEVIGPFGPAGVFAPFRRGERAVRLAAWTQTTRTAQLLAAAGRTITGRTGAPADWGGMGMFLRQQIRASDPRLDAVRAHFRANLLAIARSAADAGAQTLLCTVLTNQRDFAPFRSLHRDGLTPAELTVWQEHVDAAIVAERRGDPGTAEREFRAALAIDGEFAELRFRLGRLLLQLGRDEDARSELRRAQDLDALRFRTDSTLNEVIRDTAAIAPATTLVDVASQLAARSAHGVPGDDLLYEHVHLTFRGTYEVASELLPRIAEALQRRRLAGEAPQPTLSLAEVRARLAFTTYDQTMIGLELLHRFGAAPFTGQIDDAVRIATWRHRVETGTALLSQPGATDALVAIYRAARASAPDDWILARNEGEMLVARGRPAEAIPCLEDARRTLPDDPDTLVALGLAYRATGQTAAADALFTTVRQLEPRHPLLPKSPPPPTS